MTESTTINPPRGWLKFFFKIPVIIARIGFAGWERLIGVEWMLLTTVGRKSGKKRFSMVDVLLHDEKRTPTSSRSVLGSARTGIAISRHNRTLKHRQAGVSSLPPLKLFLAKRQLM
jgi:hypothetical protein